MGALLIPAEPVYADDSERIVVEALRAQLSDDDVILHGVRITDDQYGDVEIDVIVLMPDLGAAVIEVKGGYVQYRGGQFIQTGAQEREIDPVHQARKGLWSLQRYLERQPDWSRGPVRGTWLVAFPYTSVHADMGPQAPREVIVGQGDLDAAAAIAARRLADGHGGRPPAHGWVDAALQALQNADADPVQVPARTMARLREVQEATESRRFIIRATKLIPRMEFVGSAGTGKSWLAKERAKAWAREGERVALLTYTRGVAEVMKDELGDLQGRRRPAFVGTFHQLATLWGIELRATTDADYWMRELPEQMLAAVASLRPADRFTAFVIDEAQDFADHWWQVILAAGRDEHVRLAVFRDDEQAVFTERKGRPDVDLVPFILDENLRNTRQIVDAFRPLISARPVARGGQGPEVEIVTCPAQDVMGTADDMVADLHDRRGYLPEHIALLTTLHRHNVQRELDADKAAYWQEFLDGNDVFYSTVSGFKGLERPAIVLAIDGFHEGVNPASVRYAGMSRATELLIVVQPDSA